MEMSKEEKAILLLEVYNQEVNRLGAETLEKKAELIRSRADGELTQPAIDLKLKEINEYNELEKGRIERRFLRAICSLEE